MCVSAGLVTDWLFEHAGIVGAFWMLGDGFNSFRSLFPVLGLGWCGFGKGRVRAAHEAQVSEARPGAPSVVLVKSGPPATFDHFD